MAIRDLHPYESFLVTSNMGLSLTLLGNVTQDSLRRAFALTRKEHPVLRLVVKQNQDGRNEFVEADTQEMQLEVDEDDEMDVEACEKQLTDWVNAPRDHSKSMFYFKYHPACRSRRCHVLLIVANHSAMDGPGVFHVFGSFCGYLGQVVSGNDIPEPVPRKFSDILALAVTPQGLQKPEIPSDMLPSPDAEKDVDEEGKKHGAHHVIKRMSKEMTEGLLRSCHEHGFTVQGAICAALMLTTAHAQKEKHPLPQKIGFLAPANMRKKVSPPIDDADSSCASAGLWWYQTVSPDQKIVEVASIATQAVRKRLSEGFGFGFWEWLQKEMWIPKYSVMGTTIGVVPMKQIYDSVEVHKVAFAGGSYGGGGISVEYMRHFYTFAGCLHLTLNHSWPAVADDYAETLAATDWKCLEMLAATDAGTKTVRDLVC